MSAAPRRRFNTAVALERKAEPVVAVFEGVIGLQLLVEVLGRVIELLRVKQLQNLRNRALLHGS